MYLFQVKTIQVSQAQQNFEHTLQAGTNKLSNQVFTSKSQGLQYIVSYIYISIQNRKLILVLINHNKIDIGTYYYQYASVFIFMMNQLFHQHDFRVHIKIVSAASFQCFGCSSPIVFHQEHGCTVFLLYTECELGA